MGGVGDLELSMLRPELCLDQTLIGAERSIRRGWGRAWAPRGFPYAQAATIHRRRSATSADHYGIGGAWYWRLLVSSCCEKTRAAASFLAGDLRQLLCRPRRSA
eukprot:6179685-Pleurochrysis_carterae.AAC.1